HRAGQLPGHRRAPALPARARRDGHKAARHSFRSITAPLTMSLDFDPIYLVWLMVALSAGLAAEAIYIVCASATNYRSRINHRLLMLQDHPDRESVYIELRRQRGLTRHGDYRLGLVALNRLIVQSGLTMGLTTLFAVIGA